MARQAPANELGLTKRELGYILGATMACVPQAVGEGGFGVLSTGSPAHFTRIGWLCKRRDVARPPGIAARPVDPVRAAAFGAQRDAVGTWRLDCLAADGASRRRGAHCARALSAYTRWMVSSTRPMPRSRPWATARLLAGLFGRARAAISAVDFQSAFFGPLPPLRSL